MSERPRDGDVPGTGERGDDPGRTPRVETGAGRGRRQFLRALGGGVAATAGLSGATAQGPPTVSVGNNYFDPVGLAVEPGTTVRFRIDAGTHTVTAYEDRIPAGATAFDSGRISEGVFEHTFDERGTYDYYCAPHRSMGMTGRIVVGEPGGPAEASPIPDGDVPDGDVVVERGSVGVDDAGGSGGDTRRGMRGSRPGMMGGGHGWHMLVPAGVFATLLGLTGGAVYWASRRKTGEPSRNDAAIATLEERYARGEVDDEEFERRLERLEREE